MTQLPAMPTEYGHSPSDRMQLLGSGELPAPGNCILCGSGAPERKYVFLGIHLDFLGALLLCDLCLTQSAEKIGCMAPSIAEMLHVQSQQLARDLAESQRLNEALNDRLTHYDAILGNLNPSAASISGSLSDDSDSDEPHSESTVEASSSESTDEQSEPSESSKIPGASDGISNEPGDLTAGEYSKPESDRSPDL